MTWTRLDDKHFQRPEALDVSDRARLLEVAALVWSNMTGTDGAIGRRALRALSTITDEDAAPVETYAAELVEVGLWEVTGTGWQVVGWGDLQPTAEQVEAKKAEERGRRRSRAPARAAVTTACASLCREVRASRDAGGDA